LGNIQNNGDSRAFNSGGKSPDTNVRFGSVAAAQNYITRTAAFERLPAAPQPIFKNRSSERLLSSIVAAQGQLHERLVSATSGRSTSTKAMEIKAEFRVTAKYR